MSAGVYNVPPAGEKPPKEAFFFGSPPLWLASDKVLLGGDPAYVLTLGDTFADRATLQPIGKPPQQPSTLSTIAADGWLYRIGPRWSRINLASLAVEELGPAPVGNDLREQTVYLKSATLGLAAYSDTEGCFYQFELHPTAVRKIHLQAE